MAFVPRNIRILVDSSPRIWSYWTEDTSVKVRNRGYFEDYRQVLAAGDWIFATTSTGGIILHVDEIDPLELGEPR